MKTKEEIEAHRRTCEHFNATLLGDGQTCCTADLRALPTWQDGKTQEVMVWFTPVEMIVRL